MTPAPPRQKVRVHVGRVLSRSFAVWGRNLVPFTVLALLVYAPLVAFALGCPVRSTTARLWHALTIVWAPSVFAMIAAGPIAYGVFQQLRGEPAGLGACLQAGLRGLLRVTGVAIAIGVIVLFLVFVAAFAAGIAVYATGLYPGMVTMFVLMAIFAIPAVAVMCGLWVAVPCSVVERAGVFASLRRSLFLTRGARMPIFGLIVTLGMVGLGLGIGVRAAVPVTVVESPPPPPGADYDAWNAEKIAAATDAERIQHVTALLVSAVLAGLKAVAGVIVYYDLRVQKEHVDVERIAAVFD